MPVQFGSAPFNVEQADTVVQNAAYEELALMLAHRGHHRVALAGEIAHGLDDLAIIVELDDAAGVDVGEQPVILRQTDGSLRLRISGWRSERSKLGVRMPSHAIQ